MLTGYKVTFSQTVSGSCGQATGQRSEGCLSESSLRAPVCLVKARSTTAERIRGDPELFVTPSVIASACRVRGDP